MAGGAVGVRVKVGVGEKVLVRVNDGVIVKVGVIDGVFVGVGEGTVGVTLGVSVLVGVGVMGVGVGVGMGGAGGPNALTRKTAIWPRWTAASGQYVAAAASARDALVEELLDPVGELARARDVAEEARAGRRDVARAVLGLENEDRHLRRRDRIVRAVVAAPASAGDPFIEELLDPVGELARARHVREDAGARRRHVVGSVLGLQQEDRHLRARDRARRAIVAGAAPGRHAHVKEPLDVRIKGMRRRHVEEAVADVDRPGRRGRAGAERLDERRVPVEGRPRARDGHQVAVAGRAVAVGRSPAGEGAVVGRAVLDRVCGARRTRQAGRRPVKVSELPETFVQNGETWTVSPGSRKPLTLDTDPVAGWESMAA